MVEVGQRVNFPMDADPAHYWEDRARRYASQGEGLAAVCSCGMPDFYNRAIHFCQFRALRPLMEKTRGRSVLDVGCGVGRWSLWMAARGARVTGADVSPSMVREARRRAVAAGLAEKCEYQVADLTNLDLHEQYDFILSVTVLQHITELRRLESAVRNLKAHLAPKGRVVLIEAAPTKLISRCDTPVFQARSERSYLQVFGKCGLSPIVVRGVDPISLRTLLLPYYLRLPKLLAVSALAVATAISLPIAALCGQTCVRVSWHKLFVLGHSERA